MNKTLAWLRIPLIALSVLSLLAGLWAGLLRLGWVLPPIQPVFLTTHGPLMVCGFLGTLISLERAVAIGKGWAYGAPALSGVGALALVAGLQGPTGPLLMTLGSLALVCNLLTLLYRQTTWFVATMMLGAVAWFIGNCYWLAGIPITLMFFWWVAFFVLTIVGERLELSRFGGADRRKTALFLVATGAFVGGTICAMFERNLGLRLTGLAMVLMALWLWRYDLARRTVRQSGLTRYIAASLLAGYVWLGVSGLAWLGFGDDLTLAHYDVMLHAVFLGFVFSMIFAHAPIIFPAVAGRPLLFSRVFYAHVVLLHLSLLARIGGDLSGSIAAYKWGGMFNVVALFAFMLNTAAAVLRTGRKGGIERRLRAVNAGP